jgi:hypothetical protein
MLNFQTAVKKQGLDPAVTQTWYHQLKIDFPDPKLRLNYSLEIRFQTTQKTWYSPSTIAVRSAGGNSRRTITPFGSLGITAAV